MAPKSCLDQSIKEIFLHSSMLYVPSSSLQNEITVPSVTISMNRKVNPLIGLIVAAVTIYLLFKVFSFVMAMLWYVAPVMLIAAFFIKKAVVIDYGKWLIKSLKTNTVMGIVFTILTIVGFPLVSLFLLFKSLTFDKWKNITASMPGTKRFETEDADFEILDEEPLILKDRETHKRTR